MPFSRLIVERRPDNTWRLHRPFTFRGRTRTVTVPKGFPTDFASIPRFFWRILPKNGPYDFAAVPHDYLYAVQTLPRPDADHLFLEAMEAAGVTPWQRRLMFWAVRSFGWIPWQGHARRLAKPAPVPR